MPEAGIVVISFAPGVPEIKLYILLDKLKLHNNKTLINKKTDFTILYLLDKYRSKQNYRLLQH